eukprot:TRINITY_DN205_c0_g3_i3.p1 TRINITY_DN205_c0_g3~~TRINITY_DN205_c0_g3_i3.p1  ORF type:complete len:933 (+),score=77.64 TRINITY_DN205_c0_g3_i3:3512-6310(+)
MQSHDTSHAIMRCSILAASKMQVYPTVSGTSTQFYGCGLSISQFLRGTPSLKYSWLSKNRVDHFFQSLKHFMDYVHLPPDVQHSLQSMINHFAFILTMFTKYEEVLAKAAGAGKPEDVDNIKTLGWLIFILGRIHVLHKRNEIVECACLLIGVLTLVLSHFKGTSKIDPEIRKMLCGIFKMKSIEPVLAMEEMLGKMLAQIEGREMAFNELFDMERIGLIIKKLSAQYQQKLGLDEIDERIFVVSEMRITTPLKFTPFARQGVANKLITPAKPDDTGSIVRKLRGSKRVLTYDTPATGKENVTLSTKLNEIKFSQYSLQSPYTVNKLPAATPITRAMEMNNWLQDHVAKVCFLESGLTPFLTNLVAASETSPKTLLGLLESLLKKIAAALGIDAEAPQKMHIKAQEIKAVYFRIVDELLCLEEKKLGSAKAAQVLANPEFHRSALAASTEIVLFVHNSMAIRFEQILELCEVQAFEFWKLVRPFLKFDPVMPNPLRLHLQQIEVKILTSLAWQKNSTIHRLLSKIVEKEKLEEKKSAIRIESSYCLEKEDSVAKATPMKDVETISGEEAKQKLTLDNVSLQLYLHSPHSAGLSPAHELFFQRVLHIVSSKILTISEALGITDDITKEKLWEVMKHCLSSETDLLIDRHIDQLLLCTLYAVGKMSGAKFTFNSIISHYIDLHSSVGDSVTSLFFNVRIDDRKTEDIIGFYNHLFIPRVKSSICSICQKGTTGRLPPHPPVPTLNPPKKKIRALAPESPLNASLPPAQLQYQLGTYSKTFIGGSANASFKIMGSPLPMMTPRTKALYAFGESPVPGIKAALTPSVVSERKGNYKDSLRSQILMQQQKGLPPAGDPNTGKGFVFKQQQHSSLEGHRSLVPSIFRIWDQWWKQLQHAARICSQIKVKYRSQEEMIRKEYQGTLWAVEHPSLWKSSN